jgi:hypothetical protein
MSIDYDPLRVTQNEILTEIDFAMGYYRLVFESRVLTVLSDPIIIQNGMKYSKESTEYHYRFTQGITKTVTDIEIVENEFVRFNFDREYSIEIPYYYDKGAGIETMEDFQGHWWAW